MTTALDIKECVNTHCPNSGKPVTVEGLTLYKGKVVGFCNPGCRDTFENAVAMFESCSGKII